MIREKETKLETCQISVGLRKIDGKRDHWGLVATQLTPTGPKEIDSEWYLDAKYVLTWRDHLRGSFADPWDQPALQYEKERQKTAYSALLTRMLKNGWEASEMAPHSGGQVTKMTRTIS